MTIDIQIGLIINILQFRQCRKEYNLHMRSSEFPIQADASETTRRPNSILLQVVPHGGGIYYYWHQWKWLTTLQFKMIPVSVMFKIVFEK